MIGSDSSCYHATDGIARDKGDDMYLTTWKSGSLKSGRWSVGIADGNGFEVAVIRGKTHQEADRRAHLIIALLNLTVQ